MGSDLRLSAAPLHNFRIFRRTFKRIYAESFRNAPSAPKHWKNMQIWWFWNPSSELSVFSIPNLGWRVSEETVHPSSVPKPKATHPKQPNAMENATMQVGCCWLLSKIAINADIDVLCFSTEAKGRSGQRTEAALRAIQHARQPKTAMKGFLFSMHTHKPDGSCRSMTGPRIRILIIIKEKGKLRRFGLSCIVLGALVLMLIVQAPPNRNQ